MAPRRHLKEAFFPSTVRTTFFQDLCPINKKPAFIIILRGHLAVEFDETIRHEINRHLNEGLGVMDAAVPTCHTVIS